MRRPPPPKLQTTTLWYHPSQQYGDEVMGDPRFEGRTPAYVIWNLVQRYTRAGDLVVDPFAGGGTTLDVARSLERAARGFDLAPARADIEWADARALPLERESVDFFFLDPPYSTHVDYAHGAAPRKGDIGALDAFTPAYFEAFERVFGELERCLKDRRYLAVYVSDSFKKKHGFVGIGARLFAQLERRFRPIDHVAVVRGNRKLEKPRFHRVAEEENFFLRGFNHLLIFKKEKGAALAATRKSARCG
jgi:DNA modification methylase